MKILSPALLALALLAGPPAQAAPARETITLAAAADLRFAMQAIIKRFEQAHPGEHVALILGSSGKFYSQIVNGAPFDLFFSADILYPERLARAGLTASPVRRYARGQIVLWSTRPDATRLTLQDLANPDIRKVAIANPQHAPYGRAAEQALKHYGLWGRIKPKLVYGENIAQTAQYAETGAADVGLIALSLAHSPGLKARGGYAPIPQAAYAPLDQAYVVLKPGAGKPAVAAFTAFLATPAVQEILHEYGFVLPAGGS